MTWVDFLKEDGQVVELFNVAGVSTDIIVKVGEIADHTGVVQEDIWAAPKVFIQGKKFWFDVGNDSGLLVGLEKIFL